MKRTVEEIKILLKDIVDRHPQYTLSESGYWIVKGADSGDMTSTHIPVLGYFYGPFCAVACQAVTFEDWTSWSATNGGSIKKIEVKDLSGADSEFIQLFNAIMGTKTE